MGKRRKRRRAMISSSGSAEANCIRGTEAVVARPRSSLSPNWAGHLTTLEPQYPCLQSGNGLYSLVLSTNS